MSFTRIASVSRKVTFPSDAIDTTGADLLVAAISSTTSSGTITDSKSNTWTPLTDNSSGTRRHRLFYCENPTVGTNHTFSHSGASFPSIAVIAYSGAALSSVFNKESIADANQPGSVTPDQNDSLLISGAEYDSNTTQTIDGGFSIIEEEDYQSGGAIGLALAELIQTTAAAANPTWHANTDMSSIAVFAPAAGGGGATDVTLVDLRHGHRIDVPAIAQTHELTLEELRHAQSIDVPAVTQSHETTLEELRHAQTIDEPGVTQTHEATLEDLRHAQRADVPDVNSATNITLESTRSAQRLDTVQITQQHNATLEPLRHAQRLDSPSITAMYNVLLESLRHEQRLDVVNLPGGATTAIIQRYYRQLLAAPKA